MVLPDYFEDIYLSQKIENEGLIIVKAKKAKYSGNILRFFNGKYWIFDKNGLIIEEKSFSSFGLESLISPDIVVKSLKPAEYLTLWEKNNIKIAKNRDIANFT